MKKQLLIPKLSLIIRSAVIIYMLLLIALPVLALVHQGLQNGFTSIVHILIQPILIHAINLTLLTALIMALINALMGTITAWVLVRYSFWGRGALSALVDLPFAIPTLVTGVMLVLLYGPNTQLGAWFSSNNWPIVFAPPSIILALLFITVPFVVRAVEPVLLEQDPAEEEAAYTLGASNWTTFWRVLLPPLIPAILSGTIRSFARALGEFGSIVVVSGNIPFHTLTLPIYIFGEIESGRATSAAAVSLVLLILALVLTTSANILDRLIGLQHA